MTHIKIHVILLIIFLLSSCAQIPEDQAAYPALDMDGAICEPYVPEGTLLYTSDWTGVYPSIEAFDKPYQTATFGMGCFWGPAAKYAVLTGVLRTRVGYSEGNLTNPSYNQLGNHVEIFEVDYDPDIISYADLVRHYFTYYDATIRPISQRVKPIIYYRTEDEKITASMVKSAIEEDSDQGIFVVIEPFEIFYLAESKHQLSYLKQETSLYNELSQIYITEDQLLLSILASKLNGFILGHGTPEDLEVVLSGSGLSEPSLNRIDTIINSYDN